jgi:hypothetical protein
MVNPSPHFFNDEVAHPHALGRLVVIEDQKTKERHEYRTYTFASASKVQCPCGGFMHPILGAWCVLCGTKVVQIQEAG